MADPLEQDVDLASKMLDIQRSITQELEQRRRVLEQISGIDTNIERSIQSQMAISSAHIAELQKAYSDYGQSLEQYRNLADNVAESVKNTKRKNLESAMDEIRLIKQQIDLSKMRWSFELQQLEKMKAGRDYISKNITQTLGLQFKELTQFQSVVKEVSTLFPKISMTLASIIGSLITLVTFARKMYDSFEAAAFSFRKYAGMFRERAANIRKMVEGVAVDFAHLGVTIKDSTRAVEVMGVAMGGMHNVTREMVVSASLLKAQFGISEENTRGMMVTLAAAAKSTMQAQKSMTYFSIDLASAAGVPIDDVMKDVANMSGTAFSMVNKMPLAIVRAAVEARRLNSSLNDMSRASENILDFQNSVNAEMEASVLIGKSINLQRARYLAYQGKIVESTQEILDIAKRIGFQNLDYFQMQSFARATGRSVEELNKMLVAEQQIADARRSTDPSVQRQLAAYEKMKSYNETMAKDSAKNLEIQLMRQANQERLVALQNKWNQLWMQASQIILPILDKLIGIAGVLLSMWPLVSSIGGGFLVVSKVLLRIGDKMAVIARTTNSFIKVGNIFAKIGGTVFGIFSKFGGFLGMFGKFIPILGWVIMAFQLISASVRHLGDFFSGKITLGQALKNIVYDVLLKPFVDAWEWIKGIFVGRSPSELAIGIVKGLLSVQAMIRNALLWPFKAAWAWVRGKPTPSIFSPGEVEAPTTLMGETPVKGAAVEKAETPESKTLSDILAAINTLNSNLESGKIGVYIDGQLMSATLARQTAFKGGYGMNMV